MGDIFGGVFDLNGDGITDCGEEFMAYQLITGALTESSGGRCASFDVEDDEDDICCDETDGFDKDEDDICCDETDDFHEDEDEDRYEDYLTAP